MGDNYKAPETDAGQIATSATPTTSSLPLTRSEFRQVSEPPDLITKKVFAERTSMSVRSVEKLLAEKRIPAIRMTRKIVRIPWKEALDHLRRNYTVNAR
jgi:hypothetical protein